MTTQNSLVNLFAYFSCLPSTHSTQTPTEHTFYKGRDYDLSFTTVFPKHSAGYYSLSAHITQSNFHSKILEKKIIWAIHLF